MHHIALLKTEYIALSRSRGGVGVGVGIDTFTPESESEPESLKIRRLRSPAEHCSTILCIFYATWSASKITFGMKVKYLAEVP